MSDHVDLDALEHKAYESEDLTEKDAEKAEIVLHEIVAELIRTGGVIESLREALAEIERLQGELEAQRMHRAGYLRNTEKLNEAEEKIKRVRELKLYAEVVPTKLGGRGSTDDDIVSFAHGYDEAIRQARAALDGSPNE